FQAEDGIRDFHVTGVQTCALPIWLGMASTPSSAPFGSVCGFSFGFCAAASAAQSRGGVLEHRAVHRRHQIDLLPDIGREVGVVRSEERRVGKGGWCGWSQYR